MTAFLCHLLLNNSLILRSFVVGSDPAQFSPMFRIDVSAEPQAANASNTGNASEATLALLHQMLIAQHNAANTLSQAEVDQKAMQQAAREAATKRLSPEILPVGRNWSVRDAF